VPSAAQFVELASVSDAAIVYGDAWSPNGRFLALHVRTGLAVLDLETPGQPLLPIDERGSYVRWSPDGNWVALKHGGIRLLDGRLERECWGLCVVCVLDPRTKTEVASGDRGRPLHYVWAGDGRIYYWDSASTRRQADPPREWRLANPGTFPIQEQLVPIQRGRRMWLTRFRPDRSPSEDTDLPDLDTNPGVEFIVQQKVRNRELYLANMSGPNIPGKTVTLDREGRVVTDFSILSDPTGFYGTAVTADGKYVLGHVEHSDGHYVTAAELWLADLHGAWAVPIDGVPMGMTPTSAPVGSSFAYDDPGSGTIHVGRLEVQP
jgi:hypothetical protein